MKQIIKKLISSVLVVSLLAGIMIVSTAAPATPVDAGNLIKASNFYAGSVGGAATPWILTANSTSSKSVSYEECDVPTIGPTRVFKATVDKTDTNTLPLVLDQSISPDVSAGVYELSYWLKIDGANGGFQPYYTTVGEYAIAEKITSTGTENDGWMKFTHTFTVRKYSSDSADFKVRFKMSDPSDSEVSYMLTDVELTRVNQEFVPRNTLWSTAGNGNTASWSDGGATVVTKADSNYLPSASFSVDLQAEETYLITFKLGIEKDESVTGKTEGAITSGTLFRVYDTTNYETMAAVTESTDDIQEFSFTYTPTKAVAKMGIYFARPNETDATITYQLSELSITKYIEEEEDSTGEQTPDESKWSNVSNGGTVLTKSNGVYCIEKHSADNNEGNTTLTVDLKGGVPYKVSFHLAIVGDSSVVNDASHYGASNRFAFWDTKNMTTSLKSFNTTEVEGKSFEFFYTPVNDTTSLRLFFGRPSTEGATLTYTLTDFSVKPVIQAVAVTEVDLSDDTPGIMTFSDSIVKNGNYSLIQRWECVDNGKFRTSDATINADLSAKGALLEETFASANTYRYSLIVVPDAGYTVVVDETLADIKVNGESASYYYSDGDIIIYPNNSEIFFTYMGDANKDGSADVRDLVRMKKKLANPSDTTIEVYLKKCKFETTSPDSLIDADIAGLRTLLVNP